jgi:phosphatidylserine/phosphatidylglycerophosphate/cardiolipin synthase-like enzyme
VGGGLHVIAEESRRLARLLPLSVIEAVASRLAAGDGEDVESLRSQVAHSLPSPHHRGLVVAFFDRWRSDSSEVCPQGAASALLASAMTEREHQHHQSVELVWTGPDVGFVPTRRTEQAILQVLDSATKRITLVSYAVYRIPRVREALVAAAKRGVAITLIVETNRGPGRVRQPAGPGERRCLGLLGLLLAPRKQAEGRQWQDCHPARQVRRRRCTVDVSVERQFYRVRIYHQYGVGSARDGREAAGTGRGTV